MTPSPHPSRRRGRRAVLALSAAVTAVAVGLPGTAQAEPGDDEVDIDELTQRAEELEESYNGELLQFEEIKTRVEKAEEDLQEIEEELEASRSGVSTIAATQYKNSSGLDPAFSVIFSSEPESVYSDAAVLSYLGQSQSEEIADLIEIRDEAELVADELNTELQDAEELIDELEGKREEIEEKIRKYEEEQVPETQGTGAIPDSAVGGGWSQTTPRMAAIRDEIIRSVGVPYSVGCWRGTADDHGEGRACDFMVSTGGGYPTADNQAWGTQIAQYAIDNADRLGVEYVIWEQQIWHTANRQWKWMEDRGSPTQNHYDHVHITSF
ncbi:coiled-coil domain-containing protein [Nocardiopsis algeriensis]|uniref:DNA-binding transcriptional MerR regulator n=1 Tax=Nocardiopsis algeriensis TaxID=1478215 RepID=A0A841IQE5_9ACTN|nr:hypothetical protein [Nocardiopsis algeriensis]MBB6120430.1 DNA-binding transcriptional MerR regulator [Nocardiopsis algeriensis]